MSALSAKIDVLCLEYQKHYENAKYNYASFYNVDIGDSALTVKIVKR